MEPIAAGRAADVYALDDGRVLRRYRLDIPVEPEARVMRELDVLGYPVPHVFAAEGADLIMEYVSGPTILEELMREPGQVERYGRQLGDLHKRLHGITAPTWLRPIHGVGSGPEARAVASVLHLDFHPSNVILSTRGPIVIDWTNVAAGPPEVDVALTMLIVLAVDPVEIGVPALGALRGLFLDAYLTACGVDPRLGLADAIAYRLADPTLQPSERAWIEVNGPTCLDPFVLGRV